jgi:hypothetical protein
MQQAVELPRPHGEGPPVPPMWQAELDAAALGQLFADVGAAAEVLSIQGKAGAGRYASPDPLTLATAHERLASGELIGVQLRYRYGGSEWADTLLRAAAGFRLVRCRVSEG